MARFDICRDAAILPQLEEEPTSYGQDRSVEIDPKRSFKAPHSPTTEVLGSASHRLGRLREGHQRRREFIALMGASATWPFTALAQQAGRTYRLGMVSPLPCEATPSTSPLTLAFQDGLRHLGFVKDQNLTFACRDVGHNIDLSSQYAAELVKGAVDVIVVFGDVAARAAQQATKTIPIVVATDDMLGEGLVSSLARPDGNTTGISILAGELDGKRQEILIEAVPGVRRIATLADSNVSAVAKLNEMQEAARARNIELSIHRVASGKEIAAAIDMAHASGSAALNVLASPLLMAYRRMIMIELQYCTCQPCINGRKWRRKAALPPMDRASRKSVYSWPDRSPRCSAALRSPIFRSSSRPSSNFGSTSRPRMRLASRCPSHCWHVPTR